MAEEMSIAELSAIAAGNVRRVYEAGIGIGAGEYYVKISSASPSKATVSAAITVASAGREQALERKDVRVAALPDGAMGIGSYAFQNMSDMKILIPLYRKNTITKILDFAFDGCTALERADLRATGIIGEHAFRSCSKLKAVLLKSGANIGYGAFSGISPDAFRTAEYGGNAFTYLGTEEGEIIYASKIKINNSFGTVALPSSLRYAVAPLLENPERLVHLIAPSLFRKERGFIGSAPSLTELDLYSLVAYGSDGVMSEVKSLSQLVTDKEDSELDQKSYLDNSLAFPSLSRLSVRSGDLPSNSLRGCTALASLDIGSEGRCTVYQNALRNCSRLKRLSVGRYVVGFGGESLYGCNALTDISVDGDNPYLSQRSGEGDDFPDGCNIYDKSKTRLIAVAPSSSIRCLRVPDGTVAIEQYALSGIYNLTSLTLPASVTEIGKRFLNGSNKIVSITVDRKNPIYASYKGNMGWYGDYEEYEDDTVYDTRDGTLIAAAKAYSYNPILYRIDERIKRIASRAFYGSRIDYGEIEIASSVTEIAFDAFIGLENCTLRFKGEIPPGAPWGAKESVSIEQI